MKKLTLKDVLCVEEFSEMLDYILNEFVDEGYHRNGNKVYINTENEEFSLTLEGARLMYNRIRGCYITINQEKIKGGIKYTIEA